MMERRDPVILNKAELDALPFASVNVPHRFEMIGMVLVTLIMSAAIALNMPEPADCGVDRDAPTLEAGCQ